jgi:Ca-activated chloride channel family protein
MSEFQFLRPYWLLAFIPLIYLIWRLWHQQQRQSGWKAWIDPQFHRYLLPEDRSLRAVWPWDKLGLALIGSLVILALSGPSWHSEVVATQKNETGSVILLDLSLSMYADDIPPNRLLRTQFKLTDFIKQNSDLRLGMVAYSGSAHVITPVADDPVTLLNLLPHLSPLTMPSYGSDAVSAMQKAIELLKGANIQQGHLIWLTDDIEDNQIQPIIDLLTPHSIHLTIMVVGTSEGGAVNIPDFGLLKDQNDRLVQAQVPLDRFVELAQRTGAQLSRLQLDNNDLDGLRPPFTPIQTQQEQTNPQTQALDYGVYLLIFVVVLSALAARRGWLVALAWLSFIPLHLTTSPNAWAEEVTQSTKPEVSFSDRWRHLLMTGDQRGYQAWQAENYTAAEREFEDSNWRASALYRQGDYPKAAELFARDKTAQGYYNLGNAQAQMGQLEQAKQAYQQALALQPDFAQAKENLALIEQALKQMQTESETDPSQSDSASSPQPSEQSGSASSGQAGDTESASSPSSGSDPKDSDKQSNKEGQTAEAGEASNGNPGHNSGEHSSNPANTYELAQSLNEPPDTKPTDADKLEPMAQQDAKPTENEQSIHSLSALDAETDDSALTQAEREKRQAEQAWLNQIRDEPGVFLKRKFSYQYQQNPPSNPQQSNQKLW